MNKQNKRKIKNKKKTTQPQQHLERHWGMKRRQAKAIPGGWRRVNFILMGPRMLMAGWEKPSSTEFQKRCVLAKHEDLGAPEWSQCQSLHPAHGYFRMILMVWALEANGKVGEHWFRVSVLILHCLAGRKDGKEFPISVFLPAFAQTSKKDRNNEFGPQSSLQ